MATADHDLVLRRAGPGDLEWIQAQYAVAYFQPAGVTHVVVIAEVHGVRAGLGRLVPAGDGVFELGGIYVRPEFRGRNVSRRLVRHLVELAGPARVFCIPYAHLAALYAGEGFVVVASLREVPAAVLEKLEWCKHHYLQPVCLMQNGGARARS